MAIPDVGAPCPAINCTATNHPKLTNQDFKNRPLILYFYPRDNTPGCTKQSEGFRDLFSAFQKENALIFGISRDSLASHEKFKAKLDLPFELITDSDETLCQLFDVMKMKNMYGKKVRGIERSTFLFDKKGILRQVWRKVKVDGHVQEVLEATQSL